MRFSDSKTLPEIRHSSKYPAPRRVSDFQRKKLNYENNTLRIPPSNWFLRPAHQRVNSSYESTLRKIRKIANGGVPTGEEVHVRKRLPLEEEYGIRSFCPETLGHLLPYPYIAKEEDDPTAYYSDFHTNILLKTDDYLRKSLMPNLYRDSLVPEMIENDYLQLPDGNNLNFSPRHKHPFSKRVLVPSKVNRLGNELVADSLINSPRAMAMSKSAEYLLRSPKLEARNHNTKGTDGKLTEQKRSNSTSLPYIKEDEPYWMVGSAFRVELARLKSQALKLQEENILDHIRSLELERVRPPAPKWYELKDARFHTEARRNSMLMMNEERLPEIYQRRKFLKTALAKDRF